jgi:hypothetical protein
MMQDAPHRLHVTLAARAAASLGYAFVLTALLAAGCAVGPDFKAPEAPATSQYVAHDETMETAIDAGPGSPKQTLLVGEECNTTGGHSSGRPIWIR